MTYRPQIGSQQQPGNGFPTPSGGYVPSAPGGYWPATPTPPPPRRRRLAALVAILLAVVVVVGAVVAIVLTTSGSTTSQFIGALSSSQTAVSTTGSGLEGPGGIAPSSARPLPPPIPTGKPYETDDPQIGDCADLARRPTGIIIYQAKCDDASATLILESILPGTERCAGKGYFGLKSLSKKSMCFTHNFKTGECVDMQVPRRVECAGPTAPASDKPIAKVAEVRLGQQDGTGCINPLVFYQAGQGDHRGVACMVTAMKSASTEPSR